MSLRDVYYSGSTGLQQKEQDAFNAGEALIGTQSGEGQYDTISSGLQNNAAMGLTKFTITVPVSFNPSALRSAGGNNLIWKSFVAGVMSGLASQSVFNFQCTATLNTTDTVNTSVDLNFQF